MEAARAEAEAARGDAESSLARAARAEARADEVELALQARWDICQRSNRRLIVFFGTNDCQACRVVNRAIYEKRFYDELVKQFVPEFINVSPGTSNAEIPGRYGIDPKAPLPGVVIFDPNRRVTEVLAKGEMAEVARRGQEAVQLWILERFDRNKPD